MGITIETTRLAVGLDRPLRFLQIADNHLAFADERDDGRKRELAQRRSWAFERDSGRCSRHLDEAVAHARAHCDLLLHTGDLIDFVSHLNLDRAREALREVDYFMAPGNHEFSLYVGEAVEDVPYKMRSFQTVQAAFRNDLHFASRVVGGLNLVAIDNSYYQFDEGQRRRLREEIAHGKPILLLLHVPIHCAALADEVMTVRKKECAFLAGCPESLVRTYPGHRARQQRPSPETLAFIEYLQRQPLVKAIVAGHLHFNHAGPLDGGIMQYVTGGGYQGAAREIEVV